jgi:hypothetical protein
MITILLNDLKSSKQVSALMRNSRRPEEGGFSAAQQTLE